MIIYKLVRLRMKNLYQFPKNAAFNTVKDKIHLNHIKKENLMEDNI